MDLHSPDPDYTGSERARDNFRLAVRLALAFVGLLWLIQSANAGLDLSPDYLGVRPRNPWGLLGIVTAPLVHGGFEHLLANTPPLIVMLTAMLYLYPRSSLRVLPAVYFGPGIAVWALGRDSVHLGASGVVYGLVAYVLVAGLIRRDRRAVAASVIVFFLYGAMVWGVLPIQHGVSWETHLAAAVIGLVMAVVLRDVDIPPRKRYSWEDEAPDEAEDAALPGRTGTTDGERLDAHDPPSRG